MYNYNQTERTEQKAKKEKQKTIAQLAKQIDKKEKEISTLKTKLQNAEEKLCEYKNELLALIGQPEKQEQEQK